MTSALQDVVVSDVAPGISVVRGTGLSAHAYILRGDLVTAVIDTGSVERAPLLVEGLRRLGLAPADVQLVLNTHEHFDHVGGNAIFPSTTLIAAHHQAARKIAVGDRFVTMLEASAPTRVNIYLADGTELDLGGIRLRVVHSPGHTSGSTCFYEPLQGLLFTGDTLFAGGVLSYIAESGSVGDYMASLAHLAALRTSTILPAHGRPSTDPPGDIDRALLAARALLAGEPVTVRRRGEEGGFAPGQSLRTGRAGAGA